MTTRPGKGAAEPWGRFLTLWVIPLWVLSGALFKLLDGSPAGLPAVLVRTLGAAGINLAFVLHFAVAVEIAAVGVIWLVRPLSRPVALAILGVFAPVLIGDLVVGASSCGCFGSVKVHPAITLIIDGGLLLGVFFLGRRAESLRTQAVVPTGRSAVAMLWIVASFALAFGLPAHRTAADGGGGQVPTAGPSPSPTQDPAVATAVPSYYLPDYGSWIGRRWSSLDIAKWVKGAPADLDQGVRYVVLYRKDCEHCHLLFELYFADELPYPTTVVAVPDRAGFPTQGLQEMPCTECSQAELPAGCDWFFKTPVVVKLVDGTVECAVEENPEAPQCIDW